MFSKKKAHAEPTKIPEEEPDTTDRAMIAQAKAENDDTIVSLEMFKAALASQSINDT